MAYRKLRLTDCQARFCSRGAIALASIPIQVLRRDRAEGAPRDFRNHAPEAMAANKTLPCRNKPKASAANNHRSEPVMASAIQPPPIAVGMRRKAADNGENSRPAPCEAK